ncbi:MAG: hypothetical protein ABFD98_01665 [Syntrophobacteraceae bacterium]
MTWFAFGTGLLVGFLLGVLAIDWIQDTVEYRARKKLPFDRGLL